MRNRMTFDLEGDDTQSILCVEATPDKANFEFIIDRPYLKDRINRAASVLNREERVSFYLSKYEIFHLMEMLKNYVEVDFSDVDQW